ncbi:MAG: RNA polymerase factor sigma-54 [Deltaproteobacteria bacterium]|jgi:RNA polymerase sigma-54 factor|nr:RNA polymerase factor sigma-54 [Deltaproteobacteria bacterium]
MALELRQQLKLTTQLVMTPQLQQAIKLLQLSRLELLETVQNELLDNPFLEETQEEALPDNDEKRPEAEEATGYEQEAVRNADWEDYLGEFASTPRLSQTREYESFEDITPFETRYSGKPSLEGHLLWQLRLSSLTDAQKDIGEIIIGNLSSTGYLQATLDEIAEMAERTPDEVLTVLEIVQQFDPVGVAARTPQECLLVQLKVLRYDRDPILVELVRDHLEDLEERRYKPLLRKFKLEMEEIKEYMDIIQSLDPLPGASFGGGDSVYVSPDVFVYQHGDDFLIVLNDDGLPSLQLSPAYETRLALMSDKEKEYCAERMRSASWLIKSLHQRQRTLYRVMESIVKHQKAFFAEGVSRLAPLILKDIAEDIEMHESTVSRITTNKYVATPHGVFELKFFFNSALGLDDGSQVGSESVKALLKKFIAEEDPKEPLSDERLGDMLKEHVKVNIARRTVAKYRTAMNIPSSSRRKEHF